MFSLCIPTLDRYEGFLKNNLIHYINNNLVDEIIITDENGNDVDKIKKYFPNISKLVLIKNEKKLGPFLNKLKACKIAKNEWIVLIDSDNFADINYFEIAKKYIEDIVKENKNIILAPSKAMPNFDYSHLSGFIYNKNTFKDNLINENKFIKQHNSPSTTLMNTGNYVINKYLINNLDITNEINNIELSSSCDVIYFNTLLFEQLDLNLHVVNNLEYNHVVHNGSIYIQTSYQYRNFADIIHKRYNNLI